MFEMLLFSGKISGMIIAGGYDVSRDGSSSVDFFAGDLGMKQLPNLPQNINGSSLVSHNGNIILCGGFGNLEKCLQMNNGTWKEHSTLNKQRFLHSAVTTQVATFVFGGRHSKKTYEYLPKDSTTWLMGKTEIPGWSVGGYAIAVKSGQEIWLIGGGRTEKRILCFNVNDHTFQVLPFQLCLGREGHRCDFIPNTNKIMITGGYSDGSLDSVEILDCEDGSVTMGSPMNYKRIFHGMGIVTVNDKDRVAVFGGLKSLGRGNELDIVEFYNTQTEKWEMTELKLWEPKFGFGFLTIKLGDILSQL